MLDFVGILEGRKLQAGVLIALAAVFVINFVARTPIYLVVSGAGLIGFYFSAKRLQEQFEVPIIFRRDEGLNYWGGAFGGVVGGLSGYYGAFRVNEISLMEFAAELSLISVILILCSTLFMGTVLQDVEDGYIEV